MRQHAPALRRDVLPWGVLGLLLNLLPSIMPAVDAAGSLAASAAYAVMAVRLHRQLLLAGENNDHPAYMRDYAGFVIWSLAIASIPAASLLLLLLGGGRLALAFPLLLPPVLYLCARLSLILPCRALGDTSSISLVWSWSRSNGWKLVRTLYGVLMILAAFKVALSQSLGKELASLLVTLASLPATMLFVAVLSLAYRDLRSLSERPTSPAT